MVEKYEKRNEKYFENLPVWPEAVIFDKTVDGLIPSARLETWEQFHDVVKHFREDGGSDEYVYRSQHRYSWFLSPTLSRITGDGGVDEELAQKQLRNFRLSIRGRLPRSAVLVEGDEELWAIGQHHGLDTPLLDWTAAPFVALFFAFEKQDPPDWVDNKGDPINHSRTVFVVNKSFIEDSAEEDDKYPRIIEPSTDDHGRLVNQAGLFTIAPYSETLESSLIRALDDSSVDVNDPAQLAKYICKIHVPNSPDIRMDCLRQLRKMNIHHASLFPDVIGSSQYSNELAREFVAVRKVAEPSRPRAYATLEQFFEKDRLKSGDEALKPLVEALLLNGEINEKFTMRDLRPIALAVVEFVNKEAGVDWEKRDSIKARLRTIVRRRLAKIGFDPELLKDAAKAIVDKAAEISLASSLLGDEPEAED